MALKLRWPRRHRPSDDATRSGALRMLRGLRRQQRSLHNGPAEADKGNSTNDLQNSIHLSYFDGRGL